MKFSRRFNRIFSRLAALGVVAFLVLEGREALTAGTRRRLLLVLIR